jgi:multidrug resistance efflux pump
VESDSATVQNAEAAIARAQYDYYNSVATLRQSEADNRKSQADLARYKELVGKHEIALSEYDQYVATAASQQAAVEAGRAAAESSRKMVDARRAQLSEQESKLREDRQNAPRQVAIRQANIKSQAANAAAAKAQLDTALLNLSYCHIVSPVDGIASQRSAEDWRKSFGGPATGGDRADRERVGDSRFQRDATRKNARRPGCQRGGRCVKQNVCGDSGVHARRHGRSNQSFST